MTAPRAAVCPWYLTADRDRRRVEQFGQPRPGERGADDGPPLVIYDELAGAADALALGVRAGDLPRRRADHRDLQPGGSRLCGGTADGAHLRVGERHPGHDVGSGHVSAEDRRSGDAAVVLAHVSERGESVAVTDRIQPSARDADRPQRGVHGDRTSGRQPGMLQAETGGGGPAAHRDQDLVACELLPARRAAVIRTPVTTVMPSASNAARSSSPANGSSRASSRSAPSSTTTCSLPSRLNACAISTPTAPPPSTSSRGGTSLALVAERLSHGRASASPGMGGIIAVLPVASTTALAARSGTMRPSAAWTSTARSPVRRPVPRISVMPLLSSQPSCPSSRQPEVM